MSKNIAMLTFKASACVMIITVLIMNHNDSAQTILPKTLMTIIYSANPKTLEQVNSTISQPILQSFKFA